MTNARKTGAVPSGHQIKGERFCSLGGELAHTLVNPDEYNADSPFLGDTDSLVNIGREIRGRHLHLILDELNRMLPGANFRL